VDAHAKLIKLERTFGFTLLDQVYKLTLPTHLGSTASFDSPGQEQALKAFDLFLISENSKTML
jgi:hypothetical protein